MTNPTTTLTLAAFLEARLDEDEAVAREAAVAGAEWSAVVRHEALRLETEDCTPLTMDREGLSDSVKDFAAPHFARHDPARVLAECAAKRAIVETAQATDEPGLHVETFTAMDDTLRHLAAVYANHPDYDAAWAVS